MKRFLVLCLVLVWSAAGIAQTPPASVPQIWIAASGRADSEAMWTKDAPWPQAANRTKVIVLVHQTINQASIPWLVQVRDFAREHGWQIDLSTEAVAKMPNETCGGQEGYTWPGENGGAAKILFDLGFKVDWVDMDGPMIAGSYDTSTAGCRLSIPALVDRVSATLQDVVALYPHVKLVHGEPLPVLQRQPHWKEDVEAFQTGLAHKLGVRVVAMQADVHWTDPGWSQAMKDLHAHLREKNQLLSIIYNPSAGVGTDADAVRTMVENFDAVEGRLNIIPDIALIESWVPNPVFAMPETSPTTVSWVVNRYHAARSRLLAQFVGQGVKGRLTNWNDRPIPNVTIKGYKPGVDFSTPLPRAVRTGVVPTNAVSALMMVRINTECECDGANHIVFGPIGYRERSGGSRASIFSWPKNLQRYGGTIVRGKLVGGEAVTEVVAPPGQTFAPNSDVFPVTPGAEFEFVVPGATVGGRDWNGYAAIAWIDAAGKGIDRFVLTPPPGKALMATTTTRPDGTFLLRGLPRGVDGPASVTVEFEGDATFRPSVWTPAQ